jgi:hypothetical protein
VGGVTAVVGRCGVRLRLGAAAIPAACLRVSAKRKPARCNEIYGDARSRTMSPKPLRATMMDDTVSGMDVPAASTIKPDSTEHGHACYAALDTRCTRARRSVASELTRGKPPGLTDQSVIAVQPMRQSRLRSEQTGQAGRQTRPRWQRTAKRKANHSQANTNCVAFPPAMQHTHP